MVMGHWLSFAAGAFLLAMVLYGHYRGFLRMAVTIVALVFSILVTRGATPYVANRIKENTQVRSHIEHALADLSGFAGDSGNGVLPAQQRSAIEQLKLPKQMKEILLENNNSEIYSLLGVDTFLEYVGDYLTSMVLNMITAAVLFVLMNVFLRFLIHWLNLIARLPVLSGLNQIAGALAGAVQGLLWLWGGCVLVDICSHTEWASAVMGQIQKSSWLMFLYQNNLINWVFMNILRIFV
ncbi:CvpA family protein [Clostridiaceae bacterium]|nr:CvpA family protein [Clostridiaceae bacterium]RKI08728.1 CvpA family protein [bacterium 1XD21-70]